MIELPGQLVAIGADEARDPKTYAAAWARAQALDVPLVVTPESAGAIGKPVTPAPSPPPAPGKPPDRPLSAAEAGHNPTYLKALEAARAAGVELRVEPTGATAPPVARPEDVVLTRAQASDHPTWKQAEERAKKQGGAVVVLPT